MDLEPTNITNIVARRVRERRQWSRGQAARRLKVTEAVIYNVESGRSRVSLSYFLALLTTCGHDPAAILSRFLFSVRELKDLSAAALVQSFRSRLKLSQRNLATQLGYRSAAMIHHFEKGLRDPDLDDLFTLMRLAGDDGRGLVLELSGDAALAARFPAGQAATRRDWVTYWQNPFAAAIRQLMRADHYEPTAYQSGKFAATLGITIEQEEAALVVLRQLGVVTEVNGCLVVDPDIKIVIPRDVPREVLDGFKTSWVDFMRSRYLSAAGSTDALCSIDLIPISRSLYAGIVERIRALQDEIHNLPLVDTDGFVALGWLGAYVGPHTVIPDKA